MNKRAWKQANRSGFFQPDSNARVYTILCTYTSSYTVTAARALLQCVHIMRRARVPSVCNNNIFLHIEFCIVRAFSIHTSTETDLRKKKN